MAGSRLFAALEGYFSKQEKKPLHILTPDEHKTIVESNYLEKIIQAGQCKPEDIIGVAFGTTHHGEGVQIRQLYLTQRGMKESKDRVLARDYQALTERVVIKVGSLLQLCERRGFQNLAERFGKNPVEYVDLNGKDDKKRVLIIYSCDAREYFRDEETTK